MELIAIQQHIYEVRGVKVMLDRDLAELYGVTTSALNQAVKRNIDRFPTDFMFHLTKEEVENLKSQIVTSSWGGSRKGAYVFTELGVAMLSSVLHSNTAIQVNIGIMRAFVTLRQLTASRATNNTSTMYEQLSAEVKQLRDYVEEILADQNDINEDTSTQLELINEAIARLEVSNRGIKKPFRRIGFIQEQ